MNVKSCSSEAGETFSGRRVVRSLRRAEHAKRFIRHGFVGGEDFRANVVGQRQRLAVSPIGCALFEHLVRRALGVLHNSALCAVYGCHHLAHAVERALRKCAVPPFSVRISADPSTNA
jgi:hypothetical protein